MYIHIHEHEHAKAPWPCARRRATWRTYMHAHTHTRRIGHTYMHKHTCDKAHRTNSTSRLVTSRMKRPSRPSQSLSVPSRPHVTTSQHESCGHSSRHMQSYTHTSRASGETHTFEAARHHELAVGAIARAAAHERMPLLHRRPRPAKVPDSKRAVLARGDQAPRVGRDADGTHRARMPVQLSLIHI